MHQRQQTPTLTISTRLAPDRVAEIDRLASQLGITRHGLCKRAILNFISQPAAELPAAGNPPAAR